MVLLEDNQIAFHSEDGVTFDGFKDYARQIAEMVLIGPSDWEDYSLGKDGVERYRIHNIPIHSACPGLYELGIASNPGGEDKRTRRHAAENVIVVYLGQADNVRTRLQQYGRAGAHLDQRNSSTSADKIEFPFTQNGPGLFKEIFSRGHSIMFRWVPMTSKKEAEKKEASLLEVFDYAWNRRGNGVCRREEVLSKLDNAARPLSKLDNAATSPISSAYRKVQQWKQTVFDKKAGIKINGSMPLDEVGSSEGRKGFLPDVLKFVTSRPRLVQGGDGIPGDHDICGVAIGGGLVCRNKPVKGRERCEEHKGRRIAGIGKVTSGEVTATSEKSSVCGFFSEGGSVCSELAIHGRKRCELHKGRRVLESHLHISSDSKLQSHMMLTKNITSAYDVDQEYNICGVVYWDGSICRKKPVSGRKRCEHHKGQRIAGTRLLTSEDWMTKKECNLDEPYDICGVVIGDGYVCRRKPVLGRKRCEEHKGRRVTSPGLMISMESSRAVSRSSSACGVTLSNGSICMNSPVPGRKRCSLHKGRRVT
ncbi:protein EFFECTOR OF TRANSCRIPTION 2 isoform X1 [Elaeis guineensis]|uniref:protein EFFECTOR OF TRANSCRIPTION 2 isoform X1 n=1 Tax=Elaeis guineensis var. tenera TaxID=51953 RepID=UPI003C6D1AB6